MTGQEALKIIDRLLEQHQREGFVAIWFDRRFDWVAGN
jgi:hypothetical protein